MHNATLVTGEVFHVFSKSIAGYVIFNCDSDFARFEEMLGYYRKKIILTRFSQREKYEKCSNGEDVVKVISYCVMPTHIHLILRQEKDNGASIFLMRLLNSYTRYFNTKHKRKGPLWESRFKRVMVESDEQLLHLTRYLHLNPVTAYLVNKPLDWKYSSYKEYLSFVPKEAKICEYSGILDISPQIYARFVEEHIDTQRQLSVIKSLAIDEVI